MCDNPWDLMEKRLNIPAVSPPIRLLPARQLHTSVVQPSGGEGSSAQQSGDTTEARGPGPTLESASVGPGPAGTLSSWHAAERGTHGDQGKTEASMALHAQLREHAREEAADGDGRGKCTEHADGYDDDEAPGS